MAVGEKVEKVALYCSAVPCEKCVLNNQNWENAFISEPLNKRCLKIAVATEEELDRALELIAGVPEYYVEPESCTLEQVAEDTDIVIKIKSDRKIKSLTIEFTEEVQA